MYSNMDQKIETGVTYRTTRSAHTPQVLYLISRVNISMNNKKLLRIPVIQRNEDLFLSGAFRQQEMSHADHRAGRKNMMKLR